jgi:hypothetical protein
MYTIIEGSKIRRAISQPRSVIGGNPLIAPPTTTASSSFSGVSPSSPSQPWITRIIVAAAPASFSNPSWPRIARK